MTNDKNQNVERISKRYRLQVTLCWLAIHALKAGRLPYNLKQSVDGHWLSEIGLAPFFCLNKFKFLVSVFESLIVRDSRIIQHGADVG